ncbi:MAG: hypothetical protein K8R88_15720 [Armatimonadetes bacterium]|nr:hypothetical protein [Armatimonadota bacterium]
MKLIVLSCLLFPAMAFADRLFEIPTANKVFRDTVRLGYRVSLGRADEGLSQATFGIGLNMEGEVRNLQNRTALSLAYSIVPAVPDTVPGIIVGVRDLLNSVPGSRGEFIALTFKMNQDGLYNSNTPSEVTVGLGGGSIRGLFVGTRLPITDRFRIIAEHDSRRISAGIEILPIPNAKIQWVFRDKTTYLNAEFGFRLK